MIEGLNHFMLRMAPAQPPPAMPPPQQQQYTPPVAPPPRGAAPAAPVFDAAPVDPGSAELMQDKWK